MRAAVASLAEHSAMPFAQAEQHLLDSAGVLREAPVGRHDRYLRSPKSNARAITRLDGRVIFSHLCGVGPMKRLQNFQGAARSTKASSRHE
jgi:hypothetical protein